MWHSAGVLAYTHRPWVLVSTHAGRLVKTKLRLFAEYLLMLDQALPTSCISSSRGCRQILSASFCIRSLMPALTTRQYGFSGCHLCGWTNASLQSLGCLPSPPACAHCVLTTPEPAAGSLLCAEGPSGLEITLINLPPIGPAPSFGPHLSLVVGIHSYLHPLHR